MSDFYHILDFKSYAKRAYFACEFQEGIFCPENNRTYAKWQDAAITLMERLQEDIFTNGSPRSLIVVHDSGIDYRETVFPGYKAKRKAKEKSKVELEQYGEFQKWAKKFFAALGVVQLGVEGVEADDIIAWICQQVKVGKIIYSVDEDMLQLVNETTAVILKDGMHDLSTGEKNNVPYHLTSLSKSILGDKSDEYPGVRGMGQAKWDALLEAYGVDGMEELQQIVDSNNTTALDEVIEETQDKNLIKLRENFSDWRQMWKLANLHPELCWKPRGGKLTQLTIHKRLPNADRMQALLAEVDMADLWEADDEQDWPGLEQFFPFPLGIDTSNWEEYRDDVLNEIRRSDIVAFDYETDDKNPNPAFIEASSNSSFVDMLSHEVTGASFCFGAHGENTIYVSVDHADTDNLDKQVIVDILQAARESGAQLVAQNFYFEGIISRTNFGLELDGVHDTRIMQRYWDENSEAGLKSMSKTYLGYDQASYDDTVGDKNGMSELTLEEVLDYGIDDALVTSSLYDLLKLLLQLDGQWDFYEQWAVDGTCVLQDSYVKGADFDWGHQRRVHEKDLEELAQAVGELRGILEKNCVSGEVTAGAKSLIEAEKDYVFKSAKRKAKDKGLSNEQQLSAGKEAMSEWIKKVEAASQYHRYSEEEVMPSFSLTAKQLGEAATALGLPNIEKVTQRFLTDYLAEYGLVGFPSDDWVEPELSDEQWAFLQALRDAFNTGSFKLSDMRKKLDALLDDEENDTDAAEDQLNSEIEAAQAAYEAIGAICHKARGVEPKVVKTGDELNIGSPAQMQHLLYCKIGVPVRLRSKSTLSKGRMVLGLKENGPATDEDAIKTALAEDAEKGSWQEAALNLLLKAKGHDTKIKLYHNKYPLWKHHKDGKVHPTFTDAGTDTLRPTGSSPNMLQVSKKDKEMRDIVVPPSRDHVVVAIDYASQEIRIMANEAKDPVMLSVYDPENEKDFHSMTGSAIATMKYDDFIVAREDEDHKLHPLVEAMRKKAKTVNFGIAYGAGPGTLSRGLIIPREEARQLLSDTMGLYYRIPEWQQETARFMAKNGFTLSAFGTKRHATADIFSRDKGKVARQERQGTNATIQQTAAEMLRIVLTQIWRTGMLKRLRMVFFAPIYDEVVSFVHKEDVVQYCREMRDIMSSATPPNHTVPQVPEFSIGPTWGKVHELGRWPGEEAIEAMVERSLGELAGVYDRIEGVS